MIASHLVKYIWFDYNTPAYIIIYAYTEKNPCVSKDRSLTFKLTCADFKNIRMQIIVKGIYDASGAV